MSENSWAPGFRRIGKSTKGMAPRETILFANIVPCTVTVNVIDAESSNYDDGSGPQVRMGLKLSSGTSFGMYLTNMTEAELLAFKEAVNFAIDRTLPVVKQRDKEAREEAENGGDIRSRGSRSDPKITCREGKKLPEYLEGLSN